MNRQIYRPTADRRRWGLCFRISKFEYSIFADEGRYCVEGWKIRGRRDLLEASGPVLHRGVCWGYLADSGDELNVGFVEVFVVGAGLGADG